MEKEQNYARLDGVLVEKQELINTVKQNYEKHNALFEIATSGYWLEVGARLELKKKEFNSKLKSVQKNFKSVYEDAQDRLEQKDERQGLSCAFSFSVGGNDFPARPVNHNEDYERVIRMLEMDVHDKVYLEQNEFEAYVLNNWQWKKDFVTNSQYYLNAVTGRFEPSGYMGAFNNVYSPAFLVSGASAF